MIFLVKRKRYDGSETVVDRYTTLEQAQEVAAKLNVDYQSSQYYTEPFDSSRCASDALSSMWK